MKLLLIDDHPLFLEGMLLLLQSIYLEADIQTCKSGKEALAYIQRNQAPDLVLIDIDMPDVDGFQLIEQFRNEQISLPFAILTAEMSSLAISKAKSSGALGFIEKSVDAKELKKSIDALVEGELCFPDFSESGYGVSYHDSEIVLTVRQKEVVNLLSAGLSNKEIAAELGISPETVKSHLKTIYKCLDVENRIQCVSSIRILG